MDSDLTCHFVDAVVEVFSTMLATEVHLMGVDDDPSWKPEVTGIIGLSGVISGDIVVDLDADVAIGATAALLGEPSSEIDDTVIDAVGELTNMIAGGAKTRLVGCDLRLALPTVITGTSRAIRFASSVAPSRAFFTSEWGRFAVTVALEGDTAGVIS